MPRWPGSDSAKGQFFVISVVIIATSLIGLVGLIGSYGDMRLTDAHMHRGDDIFRNVKEGINETVENSGCNYGPDGPDGDQPRERDLNEFVETVEKDVREEGMYMDVKVDESTVCDSSNNLTINMSLYSQGLEMSETLYL